MAKNSAASSPNVHQLISFGTLHVQMKTINQKAYRLAAIARRLEQGICGTITNTPDAEYDEAQGHIDTLYREQSEVEGILDLALVRLDAVLSTLPDEGDDAEDEFAEDELPAVASRGRPSRGRRGR